MNNLFSRAHQNLPLSPTERAILKFFYGAVVSAALAGATAAIQYIASNTQSVDWHVVLTLFIGAFAVTIEETARKWWTAHRDGPLGAATQLLSAAIQKASTQANTQTSSSSSPKTPAV